MVSIYRSLKKVGLFGSRYGLGGLRGFRGFRV